LLQQFTGILVTLLALAALLSFALAQRVEGFAIVVVLIINGAIGFFTEIKTVRSMEALRRLVRVRARVRRDGEIHVVSAEDLVPGDVVVVEGGDVITADLRLIVTSRLEANESTFTGESAPVSKDLRPVEPAAPLADSDQHALQRHGHHSRFR